MDKTSNKSEKRKMNFPNSIPVKITRSFQAPIQLVWNAWTKPELAKQWWGPENFTCPQAKIDFKKDGKVMLAMQEKGKDEVYWSGGHYIEIVPFERIVCTDSFMDANGKILSASDVGMPGNWPKECIFTIDFDVENGRTVMHLRHDGIPSEMHDDCQVGWESSLNKLEKLLERS